MSINVDYQPTEYRTLYWRSLIGTWVRISWIDEVNQRVTGE